jgi:pimeloyl-ACP methyl ester carboxylesterase
VGKAVLNELKNVTCPVTIMVGADTKHLDRPNRPTMEYYQYVTSLFAKGSLISVENTAHFFPQENPVSVASEINNQLDRLTLSS